MHQPIIFGRLTTPVTLFCIPKDVWSFIILNHFTFQGLKAMALVCKAFPKVTRIAMRVSAHKYFLDKQIDLPSGEEALLACLFDEYVVKQGGEMKPATSICRLFGLSMKEWDELKLKCKKVDNKYSASVIFVEVLRFRKSFAEFLHHVQWRDNRRVKAYEARIKRKKAKQEERERQERERLERIEATKKRKREEYARLERLDLVLKSQGLPEFDSLPQTMFTEYLYDAVKDKDSAAMHFLQCVVWEYKMDTYNRLKRPMFWRAAEL